jgi:hypothetical protein
LFFALLWNTHLRSNFPYGHYREIFCHAKIPNLQNRLFGSFSGVRSPTCTGFGGSITIEYAAAFPIWINHVINTLFYILQAAFPAIMSLCSRPQGRLDRARQAHAPSGSPLRNYRLLLITNP